jgi:hypothetical protein
MMRFAVVTFLAFMTIHGIASAAEDLPPDPGDLKLPEAASWVYGTYGPPELSELDAAHDGDVVCQQRLASDFILLPGGILMSEARAQRCAEYKVAYDELRKLYRIDIELWAVKQKIYDDEIEHCQAEVEKLSKPPGWWSANKGIVGFILGVVVGVGLTIGIAYAVAGAD